MSRRRMAMYFTMGLGLGLGGFTFTSECVIERMKKTKNKIKWGSFCVLGYKYIYRF